jgi:hypothetical protein
MDRHLINQTAIPLDCTAVIVVGRMIFTETSLNIMESVRRFGFDFSFNTSAYWDQAITFAIESAVTNNKKYVLFFDGDSVWTPDDLLALYQRIDADPKMDAICPVQADRNGENPLCYNWQAGNQKMEYAYSEPMTRVGHGHFGLTLVRTQVFRDMRQPWFMGVPARDGTWHRIEGKQDSDTYFWLKFARAGKVVYQANDVVLGHMQMMIRWQTPNGVYAQGTQEYRAKGKPPICRVPTLDDVAARERQDKARALLDEAAKMLGGETLPIPEKANTSPHEEGDCDPLRYPRPQLIGGEA